MCLLPDHLSGFSYYNSIFLKKQYAASCGFLFFRVFYKKVFYAEAFFKESFLLFSSIYLTEFLFLTFS